MSRSRYCALYVSVRRFSKQLFCTSVIEEPRLDLDIRGVWQTTGVVINDITKTHLET